MWFDDNCMTSTCLGTSKIFLSITWSNLSIFTWNLLHCKKKITLQLESLSYWKYQTSKPLHSKSNGPPPPPTLLFFGLLCIATRRNKLFSHCKSLTLRKKIAKKIYHPTIEVFLPASVDWSPWRWWPSSWWPWSSIGDKNCFNTYTTNTGT